MKELLDNQLAKNTNAKYFIFKDKPNPKSSAYDITPDIKNVRKMVRLGDDVVQGAEFFCEAVWLLPGQSPFKNEIEAHTHAFGELIGFFGFNYENVHDLGAEVELWIDGQQHLLKETFVAFIPPGIVHGPLNICNIVRPVMYLTAGPVKK